jgi:hypothetical protein
MAEHAKAKSKDQPLFLYLPYQAVHVGNKVTPSHPEYGMNQAPLRYIEPYLEVDTGTGPCGNKPPGKEGDMCPLAVAQRRNLSGMVREREREREKTSFLAPISILKPEHLPRQARDTHTGKIQKTGPVFFFPQVAALDEAAGEKTALFVHFLCTNDHFTKTGSGQT